MSTHKQRQMSPKRCEILAALAAATAPMLSTEVFNHCRTVKTALECQQMLGYMRDHGGLTSSAASNAGTSLLWSITDEGRTALTGVAAAPDKPARAKKQTKRTTAKRAKALSEPGIDPGHTDPEADEEEEDEEEIDFALWNSGVLAIQIGEDTVGIPAKHVGPLRDYLNRHVPDVGTQRFADTLLRLVGERVVDAAGLPNVSAFIKPAPPAADTPISTDANTSNDRPVVITPTGEPGRPFTHVESKWVSAALPPLTPAPTEAIGLPGVELDGANGINPGVLSHGMTRSEQFTEAAARG